MTATSSGACLWIDKILPGGVGVVVQVGQGGGTHGVAVAVGCSAVGCSAVGVAVTVSAVGVSVKVGVTMIKRVIAQGVAVLGGVGVLVGRVHGSIVGVAEGVDMKVGVGVADGVLVTLTV